MRFGTKDLLRMPCKQVTLRVTASPAARNLQTQMRVRVDTHQEVLARSPEQEARTLVVSHR